MPGELTKDCFEQIFTFLTVHFRDGGGAPTCNVIDVEVVAFNSDEVEFQIAYEFNGEEKQAWGKINAELADLMGSARQVAVIIYNDLFENEAGI